MHAPTPNNSQRQSLDLGITTTSLQRTQFTTNLHQIDARDVNSCLTVPAAQMHSPSKTSIHSVALSDESVKAGPLTQTQYWQSFILCALKSFGYWDTTHATTTPELTAAQAIIQEPTTHIAVSKTLEYLQSSLTNMAGLTKPLVLQLSQHKISNYNAALVFVLQGLQQPSARFDRQSTGLSQTHILAERSQTLFALCKKFPSNKPFADLQLLGLKMSRTRGRCLTKDPEGQNRLVFGQGHFGRVYAARRVSDGCLHAVKVIRENLPAKGVATREIENHDRLQKILKDHPDALARFVPIMDHTVAISHNMLKSYLIQPIATEPTLYDQIKQLHQMTPYDSGKYSKMAALIKTLLELTQTLEAHDLCHPDFKPDNIIGKKMIDLGDLWFNQQGLARTFTPRYFPPKRDHSFRLNGYYCFTRAAYTGVSRFLCGASLFEVIVGATPKDLPCHDLLSLPFSTRKNSYKQGFTHVQVPFINVKTGALFAHLERFFLKVALKMMADNPAQRMSPTAALHYLYTA